MAMTTVYLTTWHPRGNLFNDLPKGRLPLNPLAVHNNQGHTKQLDGGLDERFD